MKHRVQYYETDSMGIVHHSNYIRYFETARTEFIRQRELPYNRIEELGVYIPVLAVKAEYKECLPVEQLALQEVVLQDMSSSAIVIDASDWQIPADGWYNATHLTREAAVEFTRQIREEIGDRK